MRILSRLGKLEWVLESARPHGIVVRFEGSSLNFPEPSQEELDNATQVLTVKFVRSPESLRTDDD